MVEQNDDQEIDLNSYRQEKRKASEAEDIDLSKEFKDGKKNGWGETVADVFTQAGLGALKYFTWPADVLKMSMIGEGLSGIDEIEEIAKREGKPFDREKYLRDVFETARYIPTQELGEKGFEEVTGLSLEPKTELGKATKQAAGLAAFTPGTIARKGTTAAIGAGTTQALKANGVGEEKAEIIGDIASLSTQAFQKAATKIPKAAEEFEKISQKFALPFKEFMTKERAPLLKGKLFKSTENRLKEEFHTTADQALKKIVKDELPISNLRDSGVNLDSLAEHAYETTSRLAKESPQIMKTEGIVKSIDNEISRIKSMAPSPSDSQKAAIKILENERDVLKVSNPTSEQLINQHKNYNADVKSIYKKPEFSGKEEDVRKAYAFLNNELVSAIEKQGNSHVANAFKAANKIYHEKSKLDQVEKILGKAFEGNSYSPKKLQKVIFSKQGNFLKRNLGQKAVQDIEDIAKYGVEAEKRMANFLDIKNPAIAQEVGSWGQLAPFVFLPHNLKGAAISFAKPFARHVQGKLLTRNALRDSYKLTLKHAADGSFNLLKKDFSKMEDLVAREWGSVEDFMDETMAELDIEND